MQLLIKNIQSQQDLRLFTELANRLGLNATVLENQYEGTVEDDRKRLIEEEREQYLKKEGRSFSWEDVKAMTSDKSKRHGI